MSNLKSTDTPLSAILIATVVIGMAVIAVSGRQPQMIHVIDTRSEMETLPNQRVNTSLENMSFYVHSTIAQVLAAFLALVLVVGISYLELLSRKLYNVYETRWRFIKNNKCFRRENIQMYELGGKMENSFGAIKTGVWLFVGGICLSLSCLVSTPLVVSNNLAYLLIFIDVGACVLIIGIFAYAASGVVNEYNDNILRAARQFSDDIIEKMKQAEQEANTVVFADGKPIKGDQRRGSSDEKK